MRANLPKISLIGLARGCVRSNEVASVRINVIANYLGQGWVALMGLAFVPIYIKYLGMEAYGLIGIFAVLQVSLTVLDMGMAPTLNREMAFHSGSAFAAVNLGSVAQSGSNLLWHRHADWHECLGRICLVRRELVASGKAAHRGRGSCNCSDGICGGAAFC